MDLRKLKTLIDLVAESDISELEVSEGDGRVRIVKNQAQHTMAMPQQFMQQTPAIVATQESLTAAATAADEAVSIAPSLESSHKITSPMVGTLYLAPSPGAPNFVEIGSTVKEGQTICIIEAMKLLNEIECDKSGVIKAIQIENGQPVEFGQTLFIIE